MLHDLDGSCEDWELKGEGNANAVFAYNGDLPGLRGRVLRVPKTSAAATSNQHPQLQELDSHLWACQLKSQGPREQRQIAFEDIVLRPLLGSRYIHRGEACLLPADLVDGLVRQLRQQGRPGNRSLSGRALLLPDHTVFCWGSGATQAHAGCRQAGPQPSAGGGMLLGGKGPSQCSQDHSGSANPQHEQHSRQAPPAEACICVEIKPKCGFLPSCSLIRHPVKRRMSRYQAHQQLKLAQGRIACLSSYDPLDLFSGDARRMEPALAALFAQPQNNLRLFCNGAPARWAGARELEDMLLPSYGGSKGLIRLVRIVLQREGVLDKLLAAQKLDTLDVEVVHPLLQSVVQQGSVYSELPNASDAPALQEPSAPRLCAARHMQEPAMQQGDALLGLQPEAACEVLRNYLVAATAKDCSIMITLAPIQGGALPAGAAEVPSLQQNPCMGAVVSDAVLQHSFRYKVAFVDMDLKPVWKMEEHCRLDQAIMAVAR